GRHCGQSLAKRGFECSCIGAWLADQFDEDDDREVAEPVQLRIALPRGALADAGAFEAALRQALPTMPPLTPGRAAPARQRDPVGLLPVDPLAGPDPQFRHPIATAAPPGLVALLLRWRESAQLLRRLRTLPVPTAELWLTHLLAMQRSGPAALAREADLAPEIADIRSRIARGMPEISHDARIDLATFAELLARHGSELDGSDLAPLLRPTSTTTKAAPGQTGNPASGHHSQRASTAASPRPMVASADQTAKVIPAVPLRRTAIDREIRLTSILPFLTLGMLARIGWLDVAGASIAALGLPDDGAILAAALGELIVPRGAADPMAGGPRAETIATFAGLAQAPGPAAFASWDRIAAHGLGALTAFVADEIAEGHSAELPLLVTRSGSAPDAPWLLTDSDGGYPVAITANLPELLDQIDRFRASVVLVAGTAASPALIAALAARERCVITDAPPGRGEAASALRGHPGLWCDPFDFPPGQITAAARRFGETLDDANALAKRLLGEALPGTLGRAAALGAAMGLGLLAWTLWREREPPHPLLTLDRLGSLDGTARIAAGALEVRPAVGRRYLDLKRAGALEPISGVPWLGGRTIRFCGP
ncbi:MAG: hypothetical protein ACKOPM_06340, partial [Novosphingobium sp.]